MARTPDLARRQELLDRIVDYIAVDGLAQATLRPMAKALGVSINRLVHHFGSKEELLAAALERANDRQLAVQAEWLRRNPRLTQVQLYRKWWAWLSGSSANLALVRLGYEAAALDSARSGLAGDVRAEQIGVWRVDVEQRLIAEGLPPKVAEVEASLTKAHMSGLIMDLLATGDRARLTRAMELSLRRLADVVASYQR